MSFSSAAKMSPSGQWIYSVLLLLGLPSELWSQMPRAFVNHFLLPTTTSYFLKSLWPTLKNALNAFYVHNSISVDGKNAVKQHPSGKVNALLQKSSNEAGKAKAISQTKAQAKLQIVGSWWCGHQVTKNRTSGLWE